MDNRLTSTLGATVTEHVARRVVAPVSERDLALQLERRFGRVQLRQRLGIEDDHEARAARHGTGSLRVRRWYLSAPVIRSALKLTGLYWRGRKNAERIAVRHHDVSLCGLPPAFDGFTILQLSDLHIDMNQGAMRRLTTLLPELRYDLCVLTGDYRGKTFGPFDATIKEMARLRHQLTGPVYGVLGNHDSLLMVPALEEMGIRMLVNEAEPLVRDGHRLHLAGIDDAHYYRLDNIEKAAAGIPDGELSILLSHTPEIYRQAAHAGFDLLLSGHTHGGQICLPGAIPVTLDSMLPRQMGSGSWRYGRMIGYTSVGVGSCIVAVRINCLPEITLHHLRANLSPLVGPFAQINGVEQTGQQQLANDERGNTERHIGHGQRQWTKTGK
jgi:uncharacterized protein